MGTIKDLPLMERPRERLLHFGPAALSNAELIAILLGSGTQKIPLIGICDDLIASINNEPQKLAGMGIAQLTKIKGIGEVKAIMLAAALELGKRALSQNAHPLVLENCEQIACFLRSYLPGQENPGYFLVMLNNRQELLATQEFTINENSPPAVQTIIRAALSAGAAAFILCRAPFELAGAYLDQEKAYAIQLDAAACMMGMVMRGLLVVDTLAKE